MVRQFRRFGVDIVKDPMLVYPTLHYQNGGIAIRSDCTTDLPGLLVAGEASGGVHGRNRLMGNSLLDVCVFGRRAGHTAGAQFRGVQLGKLTLAHVGAWEKKLAEAGIDTAVESPLLLPDYARRGR